MTAEPKKPTEAWIAKHGAKFGYAYDKASKLMGAVGASGYPSAVLISPNGEILWSGHPMAFKESMLETALVGALAKPMWEWPASAKGVRSAVQKRMWADAIEAAGKLSEADGGPAIVDSLKGLVTARVNAMKEDLTAGNLLAAQDAATQFVKSLGSLPEKAEADTVLATIKANKEAPRIIKAQQQIRSIRVAAPSKRKEIDSAIEDLKKLAKDMPGSYVATEANALIDELTAKKRG